MGSPLRVATNKDDVLAQFRSVDLPAVVGMCCTTHFPVDQWQIGSKALYHIGRGDRSTDIDLYIKNSRVGRGAVRSVESLLGPHKGRALALHIQIRIYDIMFCAFYFARSR